MSMARKTDSAHPESGLLEAAVSYQLEVQRLLREALEQEAFAIAAAAEIVTECFAADGLLHIFGSGHSHMLAEEAFYRAGGPVRVSPLLQSPYMLHAGAVRSTELEREADQADAILRQYDLVPQRDCLLVVSNSGVNALPVTLAERAAERGVAVLAITSRAYADSIERDTPRLHELADVVIDNHCPPGDALVEIHPGLPLAGPASTIVGMALLNTLLVQVSALQAAAGDDPQVLLSANLPGAREHNDALVARFRQRIRHL